MNIEQYIQTINGSHYSRARVLVVGDVMLDRYWFGDVSRISPEAPVPIALIQRSEDRLGGAANVALNIAMLGAKATLLSVIGADDAGAALTQLAQESGIDGRLHIDSDIRTTVKLRVIGHQQQLLRIDFEDSPSHEVLKSKLNEYYSLLRDFNTVVLSDYGKGGLGHVADMIQIARAMGKTILVDPKGDDWSKYAGAHIITPNLAELRQIIGNWASEEELAAKTQALRLHLGLDAILLTRSQDGMSLFNHRGVLHEPTRAKEIFDVSGAGDTVIATLGVFLAMGADDSYAMKIANIAAGIVVGKLGTAGVSAAEINAAFKDQETDAGFQSTPANEDEFFTMIGCRRAAGDRIVMTNGCFDILHPGHVAYLEQARALGDRLIVAVNDDESVKRLKGAERPINTLAVRMQMLSALKSVDGVIAFSEDTPERIIAQVKPDILVKGGDYQIEDIVGAQFVLENGGEVKVLSFLDGHSTSKIIERVRGI